MYPGPGPAAAPPRSHSPSVPADDATRRAERAVRLACLGELSSARQALLSEPLAPGDAATLQQLTDPRSRPDQAYQLLPDQFFAISDARAKEQRQVLVD